MCESAAYFKKGNSEELILGEVARIEPVAGGFRLIGLLGDEMTISGKIEEINLLKHKIIFTNDG
ncbi:CooT family nickel-binding protein [bacterium]|nr:MAG: CooT family nickel-binding protein [bacterium]